MRLVRKDRSAASEALLQDVKLALCFTVNHAAHCSVEGWTIFRPKNKKNKNKRKAVQECSSAAANVAFSNRKGAFLQK